MKTLKEILLYLLILAAFALFGWADYHIFQLKHPGATAWTYFTE